MKIPIAHRDYPPPASLAESPILFDAKHGLHLKQAGIRKINYHLRMSPSDLWLQLGPTSDPYKKPVTTAEGLAMTGEWYKAQLLLYGLSSVKSPAAAKKALSKAVAAAGKEGLVATSAVVELERKLKEEWELADAQFEKKFKVDLELEKKARRKHEEEDAERVKAFYDELRKRAEELDEIEGRYSGSSQTELRSLLDEVAIMCRFDYNEVAGAWSTRTSANLTSMLSLNSANHSSYTLNTLNSDFDDDYKSTFSRAEAALETYAKKEGRGRSFWMLILAVMVTTFAGALDLCSIPTVLPTIAKDLNADTYIWVSNAFVDFNYMLTSVAFIPTFASVANTFGRRQAMLLALGFFAVGSTICGAAKTMNVLIIGRSIQGTGSGGLTAICQIVLVDLTSLADRLVGYIRFVGGERRGWLADERSRRCRGTFLGISGLVYSLAAVFGPLIGAGFAAAGQWRWLFYSQWVLSRVGFASLTCSVFEVNLPIVVISASLTAVYLNVKVPPLTLREKFSHIDKMNIAFIPASAAFVIGLSFGGVTYAWTSWRTLFPLIGGGFGMILWLYLETMSAYPTVPFEILRHRTSLAGYVQAFLQACIQLCLIFYLTTWFQSVKGSSSLRAAVQTFTLSFTVAPMAILNGIYVKKTGSFVNPCVSFARKTFSALFCRSYEKSNRIQIAAWCITIVGAGVLTLIKPTSGPAAWIGLPIIIGLGLGVLATAVNFGVMAPLPPKLQANAAGFFILVRTFGQLIGVTIGATIFQNELGKRVPVAFLATLPDPKEVAFSAIPGIKYV
ncbi:hypothetical protein P7C70_g5680, partial [Phenoliferia sp. Uapishka_3]